MDRDQVQRRDFPTSRRGYDPAEVDEHLRRVADELDRVHSARGSQEGLAGVAADQIKGIVDAAERSAREIRERAEADAAEHVKRVEAAAARLLERTQAVEAALEQLVAALGAEGWSFVEEARSVPAPGPAAESGAASSDAVADVAGEEDERLPAESPPEEVPADQAEPVARREADDSEAPAASEMAAAEPSEEPPATAPAEARRPETAPAEARRPAITGSEGARLIALNMALNGASREETARYLAQNFDIEDQDAVLEDVYSRIGG